MTVFATAMTCGMLLALAVQMVSARIGIGLTTVWHDLFATNANALRSAFGWWAIAGGGFVGSFLAGLIAQTVADRAVKRQNLYRLIAIMFFLALAGVPYFTTATPAPSLLVAVATNLLALILGSTAAFCGSWLALPR